MPSHCVVSLLRGTGTTGCSPPAPYAAAKWTSGTYGRMFHKLYQTPVVLTRFYGPGRMCVKLFLLPLPARSGKQTGGGQRQVDWIYVDDVIEGLWQRGCA